MAGKEDDVRVRGWPVAVDLLGDVRAAERLRNSEDVFVLWFLTLSATGPEKRLDPSIRKHTIRRGVANHWSQHPSYSGLSGDSGLCPLLRAHVNSWSRMEKQRLADESVDYI